MPTIVNGSKEMQAVLYTGTGATQTISGLSFQPDLIWIKSRSGATDHKLTDSVRGITKGLISNATGAETTDTNGVTAITSTGFTLGSDSVYNNNGATYVAWCWKAGQGSTSSNTAGSITSTVSANPSAGFSVVAYTGTGANATVGHGLGVAPSLIIWKNRNTTSSWPIWHSSFTAIEYIYLNLTGAKSNSSGNTVMNSTLPSSSVISLGTYGDVNGSGNGQVAYCWSEIAGFSKFGSYTGNGSADGTFVYTGFRPKFIIIKRIDTTSQWSIWDSSRNTSNAANSNLWSDSSEVETTSSSYDIDFLSNGIKFRTSSVARNASGGTYVYACFAENPFKNSLAR